jgi:hypothetical protein
VYRGTRRHERTRRGETVFGGGSSCVGVLIVQRDLARCVDEFVDCIPGRQLEAGVPLQGITEPDAQGILLSINHEMDHPGRKKIPL